MEDGVRRQEYAPRGTVAHSRGADRVFVRVSILCDGRTSETFQAIKDLCVLSEELFRNRIIAESIGELFKLAPGQRVDRKVYP